jgi:hypothetical protein
MQKHHSISAREEEYPVFKKKSYLKRDLKCPTQNYMQLTRKKKMIIKSTCLKSSFFEHIKISLELTNFNEVGNFFFSWLDFQDLKRI